jgi:hypothetical protein
MLRVDREQILDEATLNLDDASRRALARVLADWLNVYAGMSGDVLRREHLELVVETRRLLLVPDEPPHAERASPAPLRAISLAASGPPTVERQPDSASVALTFHGPRPADLGDSAAEVRVSLSLAEAAALGRLLNEVTSVGAV